MRVYFTILSLFFSVLTFAQNTISGSVTDDKSQPIPGANVKVSGSTQGTSSGFDGKFTIKTSGQFPLTLEVTMVGYTSQNVTVESKDQQISVVLVEQSTSLNEIVVSASRTPERIIESPVTIERMGLKEVKSTTAPSFYDGLENLKDVHFNTSSFNFKSVNTRGFATVGNTRFMQLVDGMDNSSPALNFVLGNLLGVSDLDVANVEILPGASSALYGANAFNGIMFMNSRNPFNKEGVSVYFKYGMTSQKAAGENMYRDFGIRAAKKFTDHFAAKANFTYLSATEWIADDHRDLKNNESGLGFNPNKDGLNTYGDEASANLKTDVGPKLVALGFLPASALNLLPNYNVARTGYLEKELNDNKIENSKFDASLHLRPWANSDSKFAKNIELIGQYKVGIGNTIYQGANRYALKDFFMDQIKFEIKGENFFLRGYRSAENAGNSYDMRFAALNINRAWSSDNNWFGEYTGTYVQRTLAGDTPEQAHIAARAYADRNRFAPGSAAFNQALAQTRTSADLNVGSLFKDNSKIHHADVNYNLKDLIKFAEIQVGGSARQYTMNSQGTIFTDADGPLRYKEYGVYTQIQKKFAGERAKFTGSVRYDKSQNFDGSFSPRVSLTYAAGKEKQHNLRASYQTGFRNPTTQDQYIGLDLGPYALIGSAPDNLTRYTEQRDVSSNGKIFLNQPVALPYSVTLTGVEAYNNSYTVSSVRAFAAAPKTTLAEQAAAVALLEVANITLVKPEQVQAIELGYRTVLEKTSIDISGYYNSYKNFINQENVFTPYYGTVGKDLTNPSNQATYKALEFGDFRLFNVYTNSKVKINSYGVGLGLNRKIGTFDIGASYNFSDFEFAEKTSADFEGGFNTPKHRAKASFGNDKLFKNFGFNTNVRYNSSYLWQANFVDAVVPENVVFDAQINYAIPFLKSVIKVGGANLGGKDYIQVPGAGAIGQQYYASWTINP